MSLSANVMPDGAQVETPLNGKPSGATGSPSQKSSSDFVMRRAADDAAATDAIEALLAGNPGEAPTGPLEGEAPEGTSDTPDAAEGVSDEQDEPTGHEGPLTVSAVAEKLGIEAKDVYNLEVSTGDGEAVTLGKLKDAWQDRQQAARETARREASLDERETALTADSILYSQLGGDLEKALTPQMRQALVQRAQQSQTRERERALAAMPELRDQSVFEGFRSDLVKMLTGYGFRPQEMTISDHRMLLVLRDAMRTKARLEKLLAYEPSAPAPKAHKPNGRGNGHDPVKAMVQRAKATGRSADQDNAIAKLISG